ncbi:sodium:proton exchanger [Sphingorhabdus soli]|uniref:Sodium:proton exchanger n=1 Tax=Flavisphingopyxis soli TaxID=2601267 RepID=A0A5C6U7F2_9SPHN|nr:cation:proton antiporter [Sphingorhabdus soli]TXC68802.1 sodium:proton exchanger [Sphingorhabdus soli]
MTLSLDNQSFSDALVILGAAGLVIPLFARFRVTPVIGFILVGVLVGPHGLGSLTDRSPWLYYVTISDAEAIEPFAEFGIILLLFSIGLELSFRRLWTMRRLVFGVGAAELIGSGAIIAVGLALMGQGMAGAIGLGLALALSSTALVLPMVGTRSPVGKAAFSMLLFEDVAIVPIIFALGVMAPSASNGWSDLGETVLRAGIAVVGLYIVGKFLIPRMFAQAARTKNPEIFLAASLLVVIVSSLVTTAAGLSPIVGALLAGLLIAESAYADEVEAMTAPFKGLALGVFLITVGMSVDLAVIAANWQVLALAIVAVIIVKTLVTSGLLRLAGARIGTAAEAGLLMSSPSETTLIVLAAAAQAQLILPETAQFWEIVTAIGLTITPILARIGHDVSRRLEWRAGGHDEAALAVEGDHVVVIGFGRIGRVVAGMLTRHKLDYIAVEADIDAVTAAKREHMPVLFGDVSRPAVLDSLKLDSARAIVLTMDDPVQQERITRLLRARYRDIPIISRARDADHAARLYSAGASEAVPETLESSLQLSEVLLVDLGIAVGPVIASIHERRAEMRAEIRDKSGLDYEPRLSSTRRARPASID